MEVPDTSSHNVFDDAARRNTDAVGSGLAVDIADVSFRLVASDPRRVTVVEDLLGGLARTTRPAEATVHLTQRRPAVPDRPPDETTNAIHVWYTDDRIAVDCATGLSAVADGAHAEIGGETPSSEFPWSFRSVFQLLVTHMLAFHERFVLHGGAIATDQGAILVLGHTGKGKSTAIFAALQAGWEALSDDLVVVRQDTQGLFVCGIPRPLAVPPDVAGAVRADGRVMPDDPRGRIELAPDGLSAGWRRVLGTVSVEHGGDPDGALVALDGASAFRLLLDSSTASANPRLLPKFFSCAAALGRLPAWRLEHAPDPERRLRSAARLLQAAIVELPSVDQAHDGAQEDVNRR